MTTDTRLPIVDYLLRRYNTLDDDDIFAAGILQEVRDFYPDATPADLIEVYRGFLEVIPEAPTKDDPIKALKDIASDRASFREIITDELRRLE